MSPTRICKSADIYPVAERSDAEGSPVPTRECEARPRRGLRRPLTLASLRVGVHRGEAGFTLAGLLVIMTIIAVFIAYTVPRQWSIITARERDQQTLFAMRQYARAIKNFQEKNKSMPVSLDQLKQARLPRFMRGKGELIDPLTGKVDWIVIPATAVLGAANQPQQQLPPGVAPTTPGTTSDPRGGLVVGYPGAPPLPEPGTPAGPISGSAPGSQPGAGSPGGTVGPIAGVRPNKTGKSYLVFKGMDQYEQWVYTTVDLDNEIATARNAMMVK